MHTRSNDWPRWGSVFALRISLGCVLATVDDVRRDIGDRLDPYEPRLSQNQTDLELLLTIAAADLWTAVLLALNAVTGTGYPVVRLDAHPLH